MSKLLSVIALYGDKSAALYAAADQVRDALVYAIRDGNTRNMTDTADAMREAGAVTKAGAYAQNKKGRILECLINAHDMGQSARVVYQSAHAGHKGRPTAAMTDHARQLAAPIVEAFEQACTVALAPQPKARPADTAKPGEGSTDATTGTSADDAGEGSTDATTGTSADDAGEVARLKAALHLAETQLGEALAKLEQVTAERDRARATIKAMKASGNAARAEEREAIAA